jgi:hypothetical protein
MFSLFQFYYGWLIKYPCSLYFNFIMGGLLSIQLQFYYGWLIKYRLLSIQLIKYPLLVSYLYQVTAPNRRYTLTGIIVSQWLQCAKNGLLSSTNKLNE